MMLNNALLGLSGSIGISAIHLSQGPGDVVSTAAKARGLLQFLFTRIPLYRVEWSATSTSISSSPPEPLCEALSGLEGNHPTWGKSGIAIELHSL